MRRLLAVAIVLAICLSSVALQRPCYDKLSPMLRLLLLDEMQQVLLSRSAALSAVSSNPVDKQLCAFIRINGDADTVLERYGCRSLCHYGPLHIAMIPVSSVGRLSAEQSVERIEARPSATAHMDSVVHQIHARQAHEGLSLPQAFTGRGVVMGVMDIGFDLTHPTFYSRDTTVYRIKAFWDQLSNDTVGSPFPVGRDYTTREELLALGHARDGLDQTHGTHTLGIAAGSGYDTDYRGIAPESDICIVANAVSDDLAYIDSADVYKYTFATDALGFKYIFDYADKVGKPCVISFSEGSGEDFWGYDVLYYEMLDSLVGPGRIIVASAGNEGRVKSWIHKEKGVQSCGTFLMSSSKNMLLTLKSADDFALRLVSYSEDHSDTLTVSMREVLEQADSSLFIAADGTNMLPAVQIVAYNSCYNMTETCYDVYLTSQNSLGVSSPLSAELIGAEAEVEAYRVNGVFTTNIHNPKLKAGEYVRNIHSPSSAPSVICVGATVYRTGVYNYLGQWKEFELGSGGQRMTASSVGPTYDGRIKPDVMAPGANIISSYSSYYLENHPNRNDIKWDVSHFDFAGRTYAWNCNSGTSMSTPAVGGAIALWLQANPRLTPQDVLGIISRTSTHNDSLLTYPNNEWGYGEINVYAGLLDVLGLNRIESVSVRPTTACVQLMGSHLLRISFDHSLASPARLRLYSLTGLQHLNVSLPEGLAEHNIMLPTLSRGVYVVQIDGGGQPSGSQLVRIGL